MTYYFYNFKNLTGWRASVREFITRQTCTICDYTVDYMCRTKTSKSPHAFAMCSIRTDLLKQENEKTNCACLSGNKFTNWCPSSRRVFKIIKVICHCSWAIQLERNISFKESIHNYWTFNLHLCQEQLINVRLSQFSSCFSWDDWFCESYASYTRINYSCF
jgi:hypothetical protein